MVSLLNRLHRLTPYFLMKQTLKIGNAASMLNGMTQLLLAKMNLSTLTSWFGGQASDSGMNLLQQYIPIATQKESTAERLQDYFSGPKRRYQRVAKACQAD